LTPTNHLAVENDKTLGRSQVAGKSYKSLTRLSTICVPGLYALVGGVPASYINTRVSSDGIQNALKLNDTHGGQFTMRLPMFNLFRADADGNPVWLEAVADLKTARCRLVELASANPGEYFMFDLRSEQIVVSLVSASEELRER
jgi:hypothetical protein